MGQWAKHLLLEYGNLSWISNTYIKKSVLAIPVDRRIPRVRPRQPCRNVSESPSWKIRGRAAEEDTDSSLVCHTHAPCHSTPHHMHKGFFYFYFFF